MGFGGNNGLTDFKDILGFDVHANGTRVALFVISALALMLGYLACRAVVESKLGRVVVTIRDAEDRTRFLGYRVEHYKLWVFVLSAVLAGIAGALYVPQVGIINPSEFSPLNSIEMVIRVSMGGRHPLWCGGRGHRRELRQDLDDRRASRGVAVRAGRAVRPGHGVSAARDRRSPAGARGGGVTALPSRPPAHYRKVDLMQYGFGHVQGPVLDTGKGTILYIEDLTVSFDGFKALNGLTLYVDDGELRCLIGPNGAARPRSWTSPPARPDLSAVRPILATTSIS